MGGAGSLGLARTWCCWKALSVWIEGLYESSGEYHGVLARVEPRI